MLRGPSSPSFACDASVQFGLVLFRVELGARCGLCASLPKRTGPELRKEDRGWWGFDG